MSPGVLVTICDRIPPDAPRMPTVANHYAFIGGSTQQHLKVTWTPVVQPGDDTVIAGYHVYRWRAPGDVSRFEQNPAVNRISALIPHVDGQAEYTFIDTGGGAPTVPADLDKTFWYTVRAVDAGSCDGGNLSANSAPAFGVLRDREGPPAPSGGGPFILCCQPEIQPDKPRDETRDITPDPAIVRFELAATRRDDAIAWAEFWISHNGGVSSNYVGRFRFADGSATLTHPLNVPRRLLGDQPIQVVYSRVGDIAGHVSRQDSIRDAGLPERSEVRVFPFLAFSECERIAYDEKAIRSGCTTHYPRPPKPPGATEDPDEVGVVVFLPLTPTTREFRLYRRVDFGPLTLVKQGQANYDAVTNLVVEIPDNDMPASSGHLCYYGQLFDEHGNQSPLTQLGLCLPIHLPTAKPLLAPLEAAGTDNAPRMRIRWFCPSAGIERFQVWLGVVGETPTPSLGTVLSSNLAPGLNLETFGFLSANPPIPQMVDFGTYLTPKPGLDFGDGATFEVDVPIAQGKRYVVRVRTVTKGGATGATSNTEAFLWQPPPAAVGPQVPWPARPLPSVTLFDLRIAPVRVKDNTPLDTVGIRIGTFRREDILTTKEGEREVILLRDTANPLEFVYTNQYAEPLLPSVVLYRYQLPSTGFPQVSGDMVQVSPLMESIASATVIVPNLGNFTRVHDPFIHLSRPLGDNNATGFAEMYLLDTQPLVLGARYAYLLVRFNAGGEVVQVIPTTFIDVFPDPQLALRPDAHPDRPHENRRPHRPPRHRRPRDGTCRRRLVSPRHPARVPPHRGPRRRRPRRPGHRRPDHGGLPGRLPDRARGPHLGRRPADRHRERHRRRCRRPVQPHGRATGGGVAGREPDPSRRCSDPGGRGVPGGRLPVGHAPPGTGRDRGGQRGQHRA